MARNTAAGRELVELAAAGSPWAVRRPLEQRDGATTSSTTRGGPMRQPEKQSRVVKAMRAEGARARPAGRATAGLLVCSALLVYTRVPSATVL